VRREPRLPVAVSGTVATAAERRAVGQGQLPAVASLEEREIGFVMAVVTQIVAVVPAVPHHNITVFPRDDEGVMFRQNEGEAACSARDRHSSRSLRGQL